MAGDGADLAVGCDAQDGRLGELVGRHHRGTTTAGFDVLPCRHQQGLVGFGALLAGAQHLDLKSPRGGDGDVRLFVGGGSEPTDHRAKIDLDARGGRHLVSEALARGEPASEPSRLTFRVFGSRRWRRGSTPQPANYPGACHERTDDERTDRSSDCDLAATPAHHDLEKLTALQVTAQAATCGRSSRAPRCTSGRPIRRARSPFHRPISASRTRRCGP